MNTTIKFSKSVNTFRELGSVIGALEAADEVYRFLESGENYSRRKPIDFRRNPLRNVPGARLDSFRLTTPPEVTIQADNIWLAVVLAAVFNYSNAKKNIKEIIDDLDYVGELLSEFTRQEIDQIKLGLKLLAERLEQTSEKKPRKDHEKALDSQHLVEF